MGAGLSAAHRPPPRRGRPCARPPPRPRLVRAPARLISSVVCLQTRALCRCAPARLCAGGFQADPKPRAWSPRARLVAGRRAMAALPPFPRHPGHQEIRPRSTSPAPKTEPPGVSPPSSPPRPVSGVRGVEGRPAPARPPGRVRGAGGRRGRAGWGAAPGGPGHVVRAPPPPLGSPGVVPAADYDSRQAPRRSA